jgi:hypothetical protein
MPPLKKRPRSSPHAPSAQAEPHMSFRLFVRMAQFPATREEQVDQPGTRFDPRAEIPGYPEAVGHLATVHWSVQPEAGLPVAPFEIEFCPRPLPAEGNSQVFEGTPRLSFPNSDLSLGPILRQLGSADALCVTVAIDGAPETEIVALDIAGEEIPETRQSANAPHGTAFIGPGVRGLRATGDVTLRNLRVFAIRPERDLPFELVATVAPAVADIAAYANQSMLGHRYDAENALACRLRLDAMARANCDAPVARTLDREVHRESPSRAADLARDNKMAQQIREHFDEIILDPDWQYEIELQPGAMQLANPVKQLQVLALCDPVVATTLGHAVTLPIPPPFTVIQSLREIYERVNADGILPYPVIRVRAHHADLNRGDPISEQLVCLTLASASPQIKTSVGPSRPPQTLDGPAFTDVQVRTDRASAGLMLFVERTEGREDFPRDDAGRPVPSIGGGQANDRTDSGLPSLTVGPIELPFEAPASYRFNIHGRDTFGRWCGMVQAESRLDPWPVQSPSIGPLQIDYDSNSVVRLRADLSWDWSKRTPLEIRVGIKVLPSGVKDRARPETGVELPGERPTPLRITFRGDVPVINGAPASWSIETLPDYEPDAEAEPARPAPLGSNYDRYRLTLPLGSAEAVFGPDAQRSLALGADAWERVSGQTMDRRSAQADAFAPLHDPRPPLLKLTPWRLSWASRVDGARVARAFVDPTSLVDRPVAGFFVWRAHESAVLDFALPFSVSDDEQAAALLAQIRAERDMALRLALIQGLVEPLLRKPVHRRSFVNLFEVDGTTLHHGAAEISLPGALTGLEFVIVTAVSKANVPSDKMLLGGLHAIAVPFERVLSKPLLRIFRPSAGSSFEKAGVVIAAIGGYQPFESDDVRIFWDSERDLETADEVLHPLSIISELPLSKVESQVEGASEVLQRLPATHWRCFAIRPPASWFVHSFTANLRAASATVPAEEIATPRADLQSLELVPTFGPVLTPRDAIVSGDRRTWTVELENVFATQLSGLHPCMVQLDLLSDANEMPCNAPVTMQHLIDHGIAIDSGGMQIRASCAAGSGPITIDGPVNLGGRVLRLAASDPAGRLDALFVNL